ncbi:uncharacterized protein PFLUO_LOCUS4904 [Penicillium psychrofluorescens]|uniref:uncharacterized protein n=1 Tax=Penicillium psychrofluorescens TaxID=3158075 RepID=UPI003CCD621F
MAPLTRSAASGPSLRQAARAPPKAHDVIDIDDEEESVEEDEDEILDDEEEQYGDEDEEMDETMDDVTGDEDTESGVPLLEPRLKSVSGLLSKTQNSPELFTATSAQEALQPLRRTADRVTRQIEAFADKLDQFKRKNTTDEFQNVQAAYKLVEGYRDLAQNAMQDIQKQQTLKRAKMGYRSSGSHDTKTEEELQRLQLEVDTWRLLLNLISIDDPASRAAFKEGRQAAFQNLHRYSSDREVWEEFLAADQYGLECVVAMRWLEETSKTGNQDLDLLITDMEAQAERGQGLWAHGWLFTKEAIKGHKRLRAWPQPLDPNEPGVSRALLSNDKQKPLITQLDPDALTRQKQGLQKQDEFYERATWMTCWKMLRQGENWTKIRDWARGRMENWRAVSLCGSSVDDSHGVNTRTPADDGMTRMMNSRSNESWRAACSALTRSPNTDDFQRAVYALLCGETEAAAKVCRSWDDYLYVYFNRVVLSRYQGFCQQFQRKLSHSPNTPVAYKPEPAGHTDLQKFLQYLRGNDQVGGEALNPFRNLQAAILSKGYDSYFSTLAQAVSQVSTNKFGAASIVPELARSPVDEAFLIASEDEEALKIATHIYVVVNSIGYASADSQFLEMASVIVAGYIANLEEMGLYDRIPLYASLLPTEMAHSVFSKILIDIVDPAQRKQQLRLMQKHGIDVEAVLDVQWAWLSAKVPTIERASAVTGYSRVRRQKDGLVLNPVKKDLIGTDITDEDEKMIRSLEWVRSSNNQFLKIAERCAWLYRKFFVAGKLAAARELARRMPIGDISQETFGSDIFQFPPQEDDSGEGSGPSKSRKNSIHRRSLSGSNGVAQPKPTGLYTTYLRSAKTSDLETLIAGFDTLEQFAVLHEQISKTKRRRDSGTLQALFGDMSDVMRDIEVNIGCVVDDEWLVESPDMDEEKDFAYIRRTYLPELLLDYHNALYYASSTLGEGNLLTQCMTVSIWIAGKPHLTRSFTESKRMAELVEVLACSSKAMVLDKTMKDRYLESGQYPFIWKVKAEDEGGSVEPE